ncbi:TAXI family TRAP transporter solute-binding subunit [uncultured Methylibium sp.]|uniref:TAXI family TRAP transporter solute-binding subunit n=1 Tax=uncultured Methylibium sp. TaxID=381093 RepID=UPI0025FA9B0C|nr:TAXI family TRAP transporter solute-binding subunit [uncultured Methylibium sp.]
MQRRRLALALAGAGVAALLPPRAAAAGPTRLALGTATPGGGFQVYGQAYADALDETDPTLAIEPRATRGSTENLPLLEAGALDLGLVTGEVAHEAFAGIGRPAATGLRIVNAMYPNSGLFAVRADGTLRTLADLRGRRIAWGARGSGFVVLARYLADGLGLDLERDFASTYLDRAADGPAMLLDGRIDALWGGGSAWPGFTAVADGPAGARFIAPDDASLQRVIDKHPFIRRTTLPAGSYRGQDRDIVTLGSWSLVLGRATLPDEVMHRVALALHRGREGLRRRLPLAGESTLANTLAAAPRTELIHAGVRRAMRELGLPA